jgi:hypothetical protein
VYRTKLDHSPTPCWRLSEGSDESMERVSRGCDSRLGFGALSGDSGVGAARAARASASSSSLELRQAMARATHADSFFGLGAAAKCLHLKHLHSPTLHFDLPLTCHGYLLSSWSIAPARVASNESPPTASAFATCATSEMDRKHISDVRTPSTRRERDGERRSSACQSN